MLPEAWRQVAPALFVATPPPVQHSGSTSFALGTYADAQNEIFMWVLAQFVDDLGFAKSKRQISRFLFDNMSGESQLRSDRNLYFHTMGKAK